MAKISKKLSEVLESDCAHSVEDVLEKKTQEDFKTLISILPLDSSVSAEYRARAVYLLGRWGDTSSVPNIISILPHLNETGRINGIDALGRLGSKEALAGILECANDSSDDVRKFVTRALGKINTTEAKNKLKEIQKKDPAKYIREIAKEYLK